MDLQSQVRLGRPDDLYYYSESSLRKQSIPAFQTTQFSQNLNVVGAGSGNYQVIFSQNQGVGHIVISAKLKAHNPSSVDYTNLAVPRGWLAALIDRISYRVAGSTLYWQTGAQVMLENLLEASNPTTKNEMFELGGAALSSVYGFSQQRNLYAYLYFNTPFNTPNAGVQAAKPLPTELLNSPLVLSVDLRPVSSIFSSAVTGGSVAGAVSALESMSIQFQQIMAYDSGDLMKKDGDRSKMYSLPCKGWYSQQIDLPLSTGAGIAGEFNLNLVGFQSGQLKSIVCWLTDNADTAPSTAAPFVYNPFCFAQPTDLQLTLNGNILQYYPGTSSVMWGLLNSDVPPSFDTVKYSLTSGAAPITSAAYRSDFVVFPMGQQEEADPHLLVAGRYINNAIMNLRLTVPDPTHSYTLHTVYMYNSTLAIAGGDATFLF